LKTFMPIQLVEFPKSEDADNDRPSQPTVLPTAVAVAVGCVGLLLLASATAHLWGPSVSSHFTARAELQSGPQSDPGWRNFYHGVAWCARSGRGICLWLAIANSLAYLGFAVSIVRIQQVIKNEFGSGLAHIDGGVLDGAARLACILGGSFGGACALLGSKGPYGYPYRYSRAATVILSAAGNLAFAWCCLGLVGYIAARPSADRRSHGVQEVEEDYLPETMQRGIRPEWVPPAVSDPDVYKEPNR
jgi:hypothetical protein